MDLTDKQNRAVDGAIDLISRGSGLYKIAGFAGCGKTTIIKTIRERLDTKIKIVSFTGKAVNVLRKKGLSNAETIHRAIYEYDDVSETFIRRPAIATNGFCIDEASTVAVTLWNDLNSYNKPIIAVGDSGQLQPVGDDPRLMDNADITLDQIHRYEGSIAWFANQIRVHGDIPRINNQDVSVRSKNEFMTDLRDGLLYQSPDKPNIILVGFNKTRVAVNTQVRKILNLRADIEFNEQMICLHNDRKTGVYNGTLFKVTAIISRHGSYTRANILLDDDETVLKDVKLWHRNLNKPEPISWKLYPKGMIVCDYGYATTVHKFQGSEDKRVHVIDEQCSLWEPARHRYTSATRASEHIRVYID